MFNRSCSVDFLVPHVWADLLTLNSPSRTSFNPLVKAVDRLLFCILLSCQEKACKRFGVLLRFRLRLLLLAAFCNLY